MDAMILSVMYIWCQLNKETMMSFWFGMQFKAMYMPWVIMLFNWIVSGSYVVLLFLTSRLLHRMFSTHFRLLVQLCGIVVGHLYFFLVFKYPQDFGGPHLLKTPSFL
jgi:Derlin-1